MKPYLWRVSLSLTLYNLFSEIPVTASTPSGNGDTDGPTTSSTDDQQTASTDTVGSTTSSSTDQTASDSEYDCVGA